MSQSFNEKIYGKLVDKVTQNKHDKMFICNRMSELYEKLYDGSTDSARASKVLPDGGWSEEYEADITCCGSDDVKIKNPLTLNEFWIGFNYGH